MPKSLLLLHERVVIEETVFAEIRIWQVPRPFRGSGHTSKYSLALIANGTCVLRYDNEAGKGDHRHDVDGREHFYPFRSVEALIEDFWNDVDGWRTRGTGERT